MGDLEEQAENSTENSVEIDKVEVTENIEVIGEEKGEQWQLMENRLKTMEASQNRLWELMEQTNNLLLERLPQPEQKQPEQPEQKQPEQTNSQSNLPSVTEQVQFKMENGGGDAQEKTRKKTRKRSLNLKRKK